MKPRYKSYYFSHHHHHGKWRLVNPEMIYYYELVRRQTLLAHSLVSAASSHNMIEIKKLRAKYEVILKDK